MTICDTLDGYIEVHSPAPAHKAKIKPQNTLPVELRDADSLLVLYGRWAQDRYQKRRCASAEGQYVPPPMRGQDDETMQSFMPDWNAMQVQRALVVVPMQYRRVLQAHYIPQKGHPMAVRRRHRITASTWDASRLEGLRLFWGVYRLRYLSA